LRAEWRERWERKIAERRAGLKAHPYAEREKSRRVCYARYIL